MADLREGLAAEKRFRCDACGNLTRFDVVATTRSRAYHHFDLAGADEIEEQEILHRDVESVTCRWCGRDDEISVEEAPAAGPDGDGAGDR